MTKSAQTGEKMVPVLYCDLDGTIRFGKDELGRFVNGPADVQIFPEVPSLLWSYKQLGWRIAGISNQGGIALGHMTMRTCILAMAETQRQCQGLFDKIVWCSHHPDAKSLEMSVCWCRKPRTGMVFEAAWTMADKYKGEIYPPHLGVFVGDRPEDEKCAEAAGLRFIPADIWRKNDHLDELVARGLG